MQRRIYLTFALAAAALFAACASVVPEPGGRPRVVATTTILGDVVGRIGGESIALTVLIPAGADPHSFEPSPQDAVAIAEADLVFVNGLGLEEFIQPLIENAGGEAQLIEVSDGIQTIEFAGEDEHNDGDDPEDGDADPHVWMDPANVIVWVDKVAAALVALDPDHAPAYRANADAYRADLEALDAWIRDQVAQLEASQRILVTDHDSLGYLVAAYDFQLVGAIIPGFSTQASPSAGALAELESRIEQLGVPAIFVGSTVSPQVADQIAADLGVSVVPLYTGSLSAADGPATNYLDFMRYNIEAIVRALSAAR